MITLVVLNWNGADDTLACLKSLGQMKGPTPNIIVCDNHSSDDSFVRISRELQSIAAQNRDYQFASLEINQSLPPSMVESAKAYLILVQTRANLGFAGGVNVGLRLALQDPTMQFAWVLNNDTRVDPGALEALLDTLTDQPQVGLCGSTLLYLDEPERVQAVGGQYNPWLGVTRHLLGQKAYSPDLCRAIDPHQIDYVVGASMFFRRELLERVGLFSEDYFLYFEELDWVWRMHSIAPDFQLGYAPQSLVYHKEGASAGARDLGGKTSNYSSDYHFQTSRLLFAKRHFRWRYFLVRLTQLAVALNRFKRRQWLSLALALGLLVGRVPKSLAPTRSEDEPIPGSSGSS